MDSTTWPLARSGWSDCDETVLVRAVQNTEPDAFGELCLRYSGRLYSYLRARTQSDEDAADLTQQVFVRAFNALPRYRERGLPFGAWLFRIARNLLIDVQRRKKDTVSWNVLPETLQPVEPGEVDSDLLQHEVHTQLLTLLQELPLDKRELILLRFVTGLTLREISAIVGTSESTIHKQLQRTLAILQEQYHDDD